MDRESFNRFSSCIGSGICRSAYPIGENLIVKVSRGGHEQNNAEILFLARYNNQPANNRPTAKLYEFGDDYLIEEKAYAGEHTQIPDKCARKFLKIGGVDSKTKNDSGRLILRPEIRKEGIGKLGVENLCEKFWEGLGVPNRTTKSEILEQGLIPNLAVLATDEIQDTHCGNWGISRKTCQPLLIDPGYANTSGSAELQHRLEESISRRICSTPRELPPEFIDYEYKGSSMDEKIKAFYEDYQFARVPGVGSAEVAPDTRHPFEELLPQPHPVFA